MTNKTIYLASPYGFSEKWRLKLLPDFIKKLESMGAKVCEPSDRNSEIDSSRSGWASKIARSNFSDLKGADAIFAIVNGVPPDEA